MKDDKFIIRKDVEGLKLQAGQEYEIFDIAIIKGDMDDVMDIPVSKKFYNNLAEML